MLDFHIERSGVPIYVQIRDQIQRAIGSGNLRPGEQLPTMRQLAVDLKVDLNTVRHAYDELERSGVIVILRARGTVRGGEAAAGGRRPASAQGPVPGSSSHRSCDLFRNRSCRSRK